MDLIFENWQLTLILIMVLMLPLVFIIDRKNKEKRRKKISECGFREVSGDEFKRWIDLGKFEILKKGTMGISPLTFLSRREPIRGMHKGLDIGMFRHSVADGSRSGQHQTVIIVKANREIPNLILRPEKFRDRFKGRLGGEDPDIDFEHHEEFSKKYYLESEHRSKIDQIFTKECLDYLTKINGLWIQVIDGDVVFFREYDQLLDGRKFQSFLDRSVGLIEILDSSRARSGTVRG